MTGRREFLAASTSCLAHLAFLRGGVSWRADRPGAGQEPWGRLERIADGVWALISEPLQDRTTLCNGGIIAGRTGAVVVESFASPTGAGWMAEQTRRLTGRWPSHVVVTHFHGDHANGIEGFAQDDGAPRLHVTSTTRDLIRQTDQARDGLPAVREHLLGGAELIPADRTTTLDLGDRRATIRPADGHTPSDVIIELENPSVVFCGDLVWNRMFPNYRDAIPSRLSRTVRGLVRDASTRYVPGHGPLAAADDLNRYTAVIDAVERAGRDAVERGVPAAEAAAGFRLPASLGEWMMFSPRYYEVAIGAWIRELGGA